MSNTLPKIVTTPATLLVADILANPLNIRHVAEADRGELADSLKAVGQLARVWVRPHPTLPGKYELVDGERRWWGAQAAGLPKLNAEVGDWSDEHVVVIAFTTGSATTGARRLDPLAEARGLKWLKDRTGATLREIGERVGVSYQVVHRSVIVLEGHKFIIEAVEKKSLPMRTAFELCSIEDSDQAEAALKEVLAPVADGFPPLSSDATHILIKKRYAKPRPAPVVMDDQVALSAAESLKVFPAGATEPEPESGFVAYTRPIPADLLKPEVAAGASIKFSDVAEGVVVYVGVDESGKSVPLVKVAEALAAVKPEDRHIFREDVARGAGIPKPERAAGEPPSRRVEEEAEERERKKAEKVQKKKDKMESSWLADVIAALEVMPGLKAGVGVWSLLFDLALAAMNEGEARFFLRTIADDADCKGDAEVRTVIKEIAGALNSDHLAAQVCAMFLTPRLRLHGMNSELVKDWHETVIAPPVPTEPEAVAFQSLPPEEAKRCTEIAKAHAAGMSVPRIAREFQSAITEICGMLEIDEASMRADWQVLVEALTAAREKAGVSVRAFAPMIKLQLGRDVRLCDLIPEELTKLLEAMDRVSASKAGKSVEPQL